jgi:hypothetical protein
VKPGGTATTRAPVVFDGMLLELDWQSELHVRSHGNQSAITIVIEGKKTDLGILQVLRL